MSNGQEILKHNDMKQTTGPGRRRGAGGGAGRGDSGQGRGQGKARAGRGCGTAGCRSRALPRGEVAEARREFQPGAGGLAVLGNPAHPPQLLALGAKPLTAQGGGASLAPQSAGPQRSSPPGTCVGLRVPRAASVPACASPSTPPHKQKEPARALARPETGSHSAAAGRRAPQARPEWTPRPRRHGERARAACTLSPLIKTPRGIELLFSRNNQELKLYQVKNRSNNFEGAVRRVIEVVMNSKVTEAIM
ncbi:uncharacterized protein [Gorilla gorilla gorilla]|uniref:uncharacterized protein n=1 Tax=Gorilla gorilla gorilla TaxID=9595 RepID=UPI00300828BB